MNEIKVNNPVPTFGMFNNVKEQIYRILDTLEGANYDKLDKLYFDILMKATNGFGFDWNKLSDINKIEVYNQLKDLLSKNNSLHEIKRLQQLAGIQEIKIQNPIISSEQITDLYNKIDTHLDSIWTFDDNGYNDNPIASDIDEKLITIVREADPSFMPNMKIKYSIPKDPVKKQMLFNKLKQLDQSINYNNP